MSAAKTNRNKGFTDALEVMRISLFSFAFVLLSAVLPQILVPNGYSTIGLFGTFFYQT
jgi:hypothetical protein